MIRVEIVPLAVYIEPARLKGTEGTVVVRIQVEPATAILLPSGQEASVAAVMGLIQCPVGSWIQPAIIAPLCGLQ